MPKSSCGRRSWPSPPEIDGLRGCNRIHIRPGSDGYDLALHCLADPDMPIAEAHRLADQVEKRLELEVPGISRVLVHIEPEGELG